MKATLTVTVLELGELDNGPGMVLKVDGVPGALTMYLDRDHLAAIGREGLLYEKAAMTITLEAFK